jgi:hypothetical protein
MPAVYSSKFHADVFCFRMRRRLLAKILFPALIPHHQDSCTYTATWLVKKPTYRGPQPGLRICDIWRNEDSTGSETLYHVVLAAFLPKSVRLGLGWATGP